VHNEKAGRDPVPNSKYIIARKVIKPKGKNGERSAE
jgi:hypothetical protein